MAVLMGTVLIAAAVLITDGDSRNEGGNRPRRHASTAEGRHSRRLLSGNPESFAFCCLLVGAIKDSGFRIGEEYSRYASLFLYRTE